MWLTGHDEVLGLNDRKKCDQVIWFDLNQHTRKLYILLGGGLNGGIFDYGSQPVGKVGHNPVDAG